jgi:hypothetical protein
MNLNNTVLTPLPFHQRFRTLDVDRFPRLLGKADLRLTILVAKKRGEKPFAGRFCIVNEISNIFR